MLAFRLKQCNGLEVKMIMWNNQNFNDVLNFLCYQEDGDDEIKRKQLKDLAILNGTLRPEGSSNIPVSAHQSSYPPSPSGIRPGEFSTRLIKWV